MKHNNKNNEKGDNKKRDRDKTQVRETMNNTIAHPPLICAQPTPEQQLASSGFPQFMHCDLPTSHEEKHNHFVTRDDDGKDSETYSLVTGMSLIGKKAYSPFLWFKDEGEILL